MQGDNEVYNLGWEAYENIWASYYSLKPFQIYKRES